MGSDAAADVADVAACLRCCAAFRFLLPLTVCCPSAGCDGLCAGRAFAREDASEGPAASNAVAASVAAAASPGAAARDAVAA